MAERIFDQMERNLIFLPESYPIAKLLCDYLFNEPGTGVDTDLLILDKQHSAFKPLIDSYPFKVVHILDEEYYGRVTKESTEVFVRKCMAEPYATAYFPFNTFKGNAFLFGAVLAESVKAVNSSLYGIRAVPVIDFSLDSGIDLPATIVPWSGHEPVVEGARAEVAVRLQDAFDTVTVSGERPSFGLVEGFACDIELFCNYASGLDYAKGRKVLDIGGGLGYGTYLLSKVAKEVVYIDKSKEAVETIKKLWIPNAPNITALCGDVTELDLESSFDAIFMMEVLEHVEEPEELLRKILPLIKEDGVLVLSTPEEDLFPYSVCPPESWGESEEKLLSSGVWPWHIQPLGEWALLPMLERVGFKVKRKSYITYNRGAELSSKLDRAIKDKRVEDVFEVLNRSTVWGIGDFCVTEKRDPFYSAVFYNLVVTKI